MEPMHLNDVIKAVRGELVQGGSNREISGVSIDSRAIEPGDLFFAFPGESVDGHDFLEQVFEHGAAAAVISHPVNFQNRAALIMVADPLTALQDLAYYYRRLYSIPVVAVTGSTGKTTTKDLIAGVLEQRFNVLKTSGNHNNEIGLPLTLLQLNHSHQVVVLEMAMRGPGQIAALCEISSPQAGVITNIGKTHLELLGSQEDIALAKGELLQALPSDGWAVLYAEDPWQVKLSEKVSGELIFYGYSDHCTVSASQVVLINLAGVEFNLSTPAGRMLCFLPLPGAHNVTNALAAAAVGYRFGLTPQEIAAGLQSASLTEMRLEIKQGKDGVMIIDDSYNASPSSTLAALKLLAESGGQRTVAALGDMYELGAETVDGHRQVGEQAAALQIDCLCTVGQLAEEIAIGAINAGMDSDSIRIYREKTTAVSFLRSYLQKGDVVLIKGSRGMKMEEITAAIQDGERR
ncbi:MAG: UDP-N-acetylmuramoyl-tripeptide--D-alanyl-D-alanine ligase [Syntrophaceticus sp.]|jgi:UDP-N-acetylmuramoyl-tripeptide--D-alanyl-D-alanine ligase|nr:UDP-N-acetylmuramoyl-tripeptide--D-alanyl-D-alanine ligase [Syntrophaceticus sp.]MDD3314193.1 UDP-N-acetylmuramoyl-tripeptide--D-alanyl-D-alanine ligase [Syntrophaceticus sp.]MDD4359363.1 UDP-N-acetylmuramoyl-tripeptide--D-alanyl-D-alanine ligase [Syntrophaceticus sp.]MDD4782451.1 UDP-N-acetylmuramoyl-tripeptide--D-alanyl-D-alanine ligase [Syntrophaceticus sp.]